MTVEQMLLAAVSALTSALLFVVKILWKRSEQCETDRRELRQAVEDVKTENGRLSGFLEAVGLCDKKDCRFARPARHTSLRSAWPSAEVEPPAKA